MRFRSGRFLLLLVVVLFLMVAFVLIWRARSREVYGPAVALCPGPDHYGYTCEGADAYAYVDATTPTGLFADDATTRIELPFSFTFYGNVYTAVNAAVNGNLQFTTANPLAFPACLTPAAGMGDLISPYWADLDLTLFGALETAVVGDAPNRVFVVEWDDVPLYGLDSEDRVTFEAQLFESSNDIVFLYQDPATIAGGNGGRAVVGLQSESLGLALSFSCLQPVLPTSGGLHFLHPTEPNEDAAAPDAQAPDTGAVAPAAKGPLAELIDRYGHEGAGALDRLRLSWLAANPPRAFFWRSVELTGDGRNELVAVWHGRPANPEIAQLVVLAEEAGRLVPLFDRRLSTREAIYVEPVIESTADLTGDGRSDVLLRDRPTGRLWVLLAQDGALDLVVAPEQCHGGLIVLDEDGDGLPAIIRDGCPTPGRVAVVWDGRAFVVLP